MKAFRLSSYSQPPALEDIPLPTPGPGEVLVEVAAAGLNFADLLMCEGRYQDRPSLPFTMGLELAGTVVALGDGTEGPAVGTRVAAYSGLGALAEYAAVPAARCLSMPDTMSFPEAAGFPIAYGTSHLALAHRARLQPGETLLVLGAGGGVGLTAVEIGALMGARVIACARGSDKLEAARRAGAHHLIDTTTEDIRETVKALGGADVVYDPVGGDQFRAAFRATRPGGRILLIGFASGELPEIPANHVLVKNISILGLHWGAFATLDPQAFDDSLRTLLDWYASGRLAPHVGQTLPLDRTHEGFALLRERVATGKIVVTVQPPG